MTDELLHSSFSNLICYIIEIFWTPKILNNFSNCEILIFQIVDGDNFWGKFSTKV